MKFQIDRTELPYDAFVSDPSVLLPIEEEGDADGCEEDCNADRISTGGDEIENEK